MATKHPRIQVTVDPALADAMGRIDPSPSSRSRLVRDLALRGAQALQEDHAERDQALHVLLEIADGGRDWDFAASAELLARRGDHL